MFWVKKFIKLRKVEIGRKFLAQLGVEVHKNQIFDMLYFG